MKSNYYDPYIAQYIHRKKAYKVKLKDADKDFIFNETEADLNKFDKIIDELEPGVLRLPVLIKSISNKTLEWLLLMLIHCLIMR
jgi:uncharacterized protein (UPF0216 family)